MTKSTSAKFLRTSSLEKSRRNSVLLPLKATQCDSMTCANTIWSGVMPTFLKWLLYVCSGMLTASLSRSLSPNKRFSGISTLLLPQGPPMALEQWGLIFPVVSIFYSLFPFSKNSSILFTMGTYWTIPLRTYLKF